jgi:hypothetical protein
MHLSPTALTPELIVESRPAATEALPSRYMFLGERHFGVTTEGTEK